MDLEGMSDRQQRIFLRKAIRVERLVAKKQREGMKKMEEEMTAKRNGQRRSA
jgi:hypothetical protein